MHCRETEGRIAELSELVRAQAKELALLKKTLHEAFWKRRSERDVEGQLAFPFDPSTGGNEVAAAPVTTASSVPGHGDDQARAAETAKRKSGGRNVIPALIERRDEIFAMSAEELDRRFGAGQWKEIGEEVTEELDRDPSSFFVRRRVVKKYAAVAGNTAPVRAEHPSSVISKCYAGPGLLASLVVAKYGDHLPLYRIERQYAREGVPLSRSTLCNWTEQTGHCFYGIVETITRNLLADDIVRTDDTPIALLDRNAPGGSRKVFAWPYLSSRGDLVFDVTPSRASSGPQAFLARFRGRYLQGDGASLNAATATALKLRLAGCMAHARRGFFKAKDTEPVLATEALGMIRALYAVERQAVESGLSPPQVVELRARESRPILDRFRAWLDQPRPEVLPSSALGKAISYAAQQWPNLERYLEDGRLRIDNNDVENEIRPLTLGRKNYLFFGGPSGMKTAATLYTIVANCRLQGINPIAYVKDVLSRIPTSSGAEIAALTPRAWKAQQGPSAI